MASFGQQVNEQLIAKGQPPLSPGAVRELDRAFQNTSDSLKAQGVEIDDDTRLAMQGIAMALAWKEG